MKKIRRILSLLLILTILLCLQMSANAADDVKLSMTMSETEVKVGETVKLTINADEDFLTRGSGFTVYYDDTVLELDEANSAAAAPFTVNGLKVNGKSAFRISFMPVADAVSISAAEPIAVVSFTALAVSEEVSFEMGTAYLYDEALGEIPTAPADAVNVTVKPAAIHIPVTGVTLDKTELTLEEGGTAQLKASVTPAGASDLSVVWTSSNEEVATVSDGMVEAVAAGSTVITVITKDGGFTASCSITVTLPDEGYTVEMPADTTAVIGGTVKISPIVGNDEGETKYNAYDIDFTYDAEVLELVTTTLPNATVNAQPGKINVLGYGEDRNINSAPFTLEFKVLKMEDTEVEVTSARVDNSGNAIVKNASVAELTDDTVKITVTGYSVTLPEGFTGDAVALPGKDYTFSVPEDYFDYAVTVTVGGEKVNVKGNGDGSYTIPAELINGEIVVTAAKTGKVFNVTLGTDMSGEKTARHSVDYTATIKRDESYRYAVTVTMGGKEYTGYAASGNTYTIPGGDIIGDIVFTVTKTEIVRPPEPVTMHTVTFTGSGAGAAQGNAASIVHGGTYTLTLNKQTGYVYDVSYKMGGRPAVSVSANTDGTYTIANVIAPLEIIIEKTLNIQPDDSTDSNAENGNYVNISVQEYLTLDEQTVFLVLAKAALDDGNVFTYDGEVMYYSEAYGAYAYLVITDGELDLKTAQSKVQITAQAERALSYSGGDVDKNGKVNADDVQLICDLYNAKYSVFDDVDMSVFFAADVNGDRKLDVRDAVAVVWKILSGEEERA